MLHLLAPTTKIEQLRRPLVLFEPVPKVVI
jgi:hypothetical protein